MGRLRNRLSPDRAGGGPPSIHHSGQVRPRRPVPAVIRTAAEGIAVRNDRTDEGTLARAFEPFFSTKFPDRGKTVRVYLPVADG
jgi:hypothetical protein